MGKPSEKKYRHEYKYVCSATQNAVLKMRAMGIMQMVPIKSEACILTI